jgi:asparagine synthase (glutamine-hydrolysing)
MCGIFGVVGRDLPTPALERILEILAHRGPDGNGRYSDAAAQVTLAHTRLAVIDLATGAQPLESDDGDIILSCNGEIYDFERIRSELEAKGYRFRTKSDSEVIIHLYREYGRDCFEHLRGEFAFLLYDRAERRLIAARDRFGIKPLYFARLPGAFVFASEMKAIFASGLIGAKLNVRAFDLLLNDDPDRLLFPFEGIEHVPPACCMTVYVATGEACTTKYWSAEVPATSAEPVVDPGGDAVAASARTVLQELEEAVRLRLRADVPVGLYLSGGLDSCFVGALMTRNLGSPLHSFSISFIGSDLNEQAFTRRAADVLGTEHHELAVSKDMLWDNLEDCLWHAELPFVSLAPVGMYLLSEAARKHVTVVLNGQGADEVFLGYRGFFQRAIQATREAGPNVASNLARLMRLQLTGIPEPIVRKLSLFLFRKRWRERLSSARANARVRPDSSRPVINTVQEKRIAEMPVDILGFLGDRVEMAHSLEVRVPFLDHELYDAAKWIPADFKMRKGLEKAVLRDAAKDVLPEDLRLRRKQGFMQTSHTIDFFGVDRAATESLRIHLTRQAFERAQVFSYGAYRMVRLLAQIPTWEQLPFLRRLRKHANKLIMYMLQTHMLHEMFVAEPRWARSLPRSADKAEERATNSIPAESSAKAA